MSIRGLIYRLRLANYNQLLNIAGRLGKWALLRKLDLMGYPQRDRVQALVEREIKAIGPSVEAYLTHQKTEIEILNARLSRRYDPGAALNEATERAIAAKKIAMGEAPSEQVIYTSTEGVLLSERPVDAPKPGDKDFWEREAARQLAARANKPQVVLPLTDSQKAALDVQKRSVRRAIDNA